MLKLVNGNEFSYLASEKVTVSILYKKDWKDRAINFKGADLEEELTKRIEMFKNHKYTPWHQMTCVKYAEGLEVEILAGLMQVWTVPDGVAIDKGNVIPNSIVKAAIGDLMFDLV